MKDRGFEALADGTLLFAVLLVASATVVGLGRPSLGDDAAAGTRYAGEVRLALFRTTMDGLGYDVGGEFVALANGTSVETFLRIQVHLRIRGPPGLDFERSNAEIAGLTLRLLRPGWSFAITGRTSGGDDLLRIPEGDGPPTYFGSGWTYPPLDPSDPDVRLALAVWLSPR